MAKSKKDNAKGASKKAVKPVEVKKKQSDESKPAGGTIGIGMPVDSETLKKMKEEAKKLDH